MIKNAFIILCCMPLFASDPSLFGKPNPYGFCPKGRIPERKLFVLSEQRAGSTFLDYSIACLTKRLHYHVTHKNSKDPTCHPNRFGLKLNYALEPFFCSHDTEALLQAGPDFQNDKLIIIVRSYVECLMRKYCDNYQKLMQNLRSRGRELTYFTALGVYDRWNSSNRHLIYYEDMLLNPHKCFSELIDFIGGSDCDIDSYIKNLDFHKKACIAFYNKYNYGSKSAGKNFNYHRQKLSQIQLKSLECEVKKISDQLFSKYLARYEYIKN